MYVAHWCSHSLSLSLCVSKLQYIKKLAEQERVVFNGGVLFGIFSQSRNRQYLVREDIFSSSGVDVPAAVRRNSRDVVHRNIYITVVLTRSLCAAHITREELAVVC